MDIGFLFLAFVFGILIYIITLSHDHVYTCWEKLIRSFCGFMSIASLVLIILFLFSDLKVEEIVKLKIHETEGVQFVLYEDDDKNKFLNLKDKFDERVNEPFVYMTVYKEGPYVGFLYMDSKSREFTLNDPREEKEEEK